MARYEVSFVIDTDVEDAGQQPWWLMLGEKPMPIEWLEYVMVRDLQVDEQVLDVEFMPDTINVIDMVQKPEPPKPTLQLVVNNDDNTTGDTEVPEENQRARSRDRLAVHRRSPGRELADTAAHPELRGERVHEDHHRDAWEGCHRRLQVFPASRASGDRPRGRSDRSRLATAIARRPPGGTSLDGLQHHSGAEFCMAGL